MSASTDPHYVEDSLWSKLLYDQRISNLEVFSEQHETDLRVNFRDGSSKTYSGANLEAALENAGADLGVTP